RAIGWANLKIVNETLETDLGFMGVKPKGKAFKLALDAELEAMRGFLGLA
ncbi:MAG: winged helix-turn-helix domain-containing protein, partial [Pleurocapsa sp. SU_196_0]|nr:winged helix-turn-helix domain-containing protein [Pleurocapsa sp. SU_196_0]